MTEQVEQLTEEQMQALGQLLKKAESRKAEQQMSSPELEYPNNQEALEVARKVSLLQDNGIFRMELLGNLETLNTNFVDFGKSLFERADLLNENFAKVGVQLEAINTSLQTIAENQEQED